MQTIELPNVAADPVRLRQLQRVAEHHAATDAASALHAAAERKRHDSGVLATALRAADALFVDADDDDAFDRLRTAVGSAEFLALVPGWITELREIASKSPDSGACTLGTALKLWLWTEMHQPSDELAEALVPLLAARCMIVDSVADATPLRRDLGFVYAANAAATTAAKCAELVYGYREHLIWDARGCATCFASDELDLLEGLMPGIAGAAVNDVIESDDTHPIKRGPCARHDGVEPFQRLRSRLDTCLTGSRIARDRAVAALAEARS